MRQEFTFEVEPFQGYTQFDEFERGDSEFLETWGEMAFEWMGEVSRSSADYVRWVQQSLNQLLGLRLVVDGISGPQTRSAVRSFQQRKGLTVDGIVGPKTEAVMVSSGASKPPNTSSTPSTSVSSACSPQFIDCPTPGGKPNEVLDQFAHDHAELNRPRHTPIIRRLASKIFASQSTRQPIRSVTIAGHTDPTGTDNYNFDLARRRAESVAAELCATLNVMRRGLARQIKFNLTSCGERQQRSTAEASRRVELFLPTPTTPPHEDPPPTVPVACTVPPSLSALLGAVARTLSGIAGPLGLLGVKVPTSARCLSLSEQLVANLTFGASLDYSRIFISNGVGFSGRPFTVAVPLGGKFFSVLLLGDLNPWDTVGRSDDLIHELTHSWQSQHHGSDPTAYMQNSVICQALALADLPIAKAAAGTNATAAAIRRGVFDPATLAGIAAAAASAESTSSYAYIPGRPFADYAAEQIAQQVEHGHLGLPSATPIVLSTIKSVAMNARSVDNEKSLGVTAFHRKSTPGVVFP
jgi:peptidoglycan hydrolase-like protein with peptidoglycan-binding domain